MKKHNATYLLFTLLLALILSITSTADAATMITLQVNQQQAQKIRVLTASALEKFMQAQDALDNKELVNADILLTEAQSFLDLIQVSRPTAEIKALLHYIRHKINQESNQQALPDLLPVYAALANMKPSAVVKTARSKLDEAKLALEAPDRGKALKALDSIDKLLIIDGVDFPLHASQQQHSGKTGPQPYARDCHGKQRPAGVNEPRDRRNTHEAEQVVENAEDRMV